MQPGYKRISPLAATPELRAAFLDALDVFTERTHCECPCMGCREHVDVDTRSVVHSITENLIGADWDFADVRYFINGAAEFGSAIVSQHLFARLNRNGADPIVRAFAVKEGTVWPPM